MRNGILGRFEPDAAVVAGWKTVPEPTSEVKFMERTLILLKPDCIQRRLAGRVITRLEDKGLNIIAMKMLRVTPELAKRHYAEHVAKGWYPSLEAFVTSGPIVALLAEGPEAIRVVREMVGATNGRNAAPGTIRGDYGCSRQMNLVHASDGPEAAAREIAIFFRPEEFCESTPALQSWTLANDEK
jgi:nucleoside-diphosphate kinase